MNVTHSNSISIFGVSGLNDSAVFIEPPEQYLSFYDLDKVVGFKSAKETNNKSEFERILYENGADITKPYYLDKSLHRVRTSNEVYDGFRVVYTERTDKPWKLSGACSIEAYLYTEDQSLTDELNSLDPKKAKRRSLNIEAEDAEEFLSSDEREIGGGE